MDVDNEPSGFPEGFFILNYFISLLNITEENPTIAKRDERTPDAGVGRGDDKRLPKTLRIKNRRKRGHYV